MKFQFKLLMLCAAGLGVDLHARGLVPSRVTDIYVMITDPGAAAESRYGHAALRFSYGEEPSLNDEVVNFVAETPENSGGVTHIMRGIGFGSYPSKVQPGNFKGFFKTYQAESRGIKSYKLRLVAVEKEKILNYVMAQLGAGKARRNFHILKYNCAVMVMEAINQGLQNQVYGRGMNYPNKLGLILEKSGMVSSSHYDSPAN